MAHNDTDHGPAEDKHATTTVRQRRAPGDWQGVPVLTYKQDDASPFRDVTRRILFSDPDLEAELRYFEVGPNGCSTLERHQHVHAVMIHRGHGQCLIGDRVHAVREGDLVFVPPMTWHQFRAESDAPLGFLCMVNARRDKPQLPTPDELSELRADPRIAAFLDSGT